MGIVFISYKHDDSGFEEELCRWIDEQEGFTGWFDKYIIGGEEWEPAIDNHIKQAVCVVVIVTPAALNSHYITYEWTLALGLGKVVIPLLFSGFDEKLLHPKLKSRQWVNFTNPEEKQWDELLAGLQKAQNENSLSPYVENALIISQNSVNPQEWRNAMKNLHDDTSLQSTKGLESLINHTLPEKSIEAAWLLAQKTNYQSEAPIDGLQKGLDPKYNKFDDCVEALGRIGGDNAGKYLLDALNQATDDRARQPILIKAIGRSKYRGAVQNLHSTLSMNDIHINTRHAILEALGNIGDKGSFEILKNIVQDANLE
nr:toll/interleukin-1 receptor domain-containing protein [Anaerolineae bacterium]